MGNRIIIKGGRIIDPASGLDLVGNIVIESGKIVYIGDNDFQTNYTDAEIIDAQNKLVVPGLIDMHVHLREPGREDEETILTGIKAAVMGGFTAVACMPNTEPPIDNQGMVKLILEKAKSAGYAKVYPVAAISKSLAGEEMTEIGDLVQAGAVAISDDGKPVCNSELMRRSLEYSRMFDIPVISHCEDITLSSDGVMNESTTSTKLGLRGIPNAAEEIMVARDIILAKLTGGRVHIAHVSTAGSVELIRKAKSEGVRITAETAPHYFTLTDNVLESFDTNLKMNPPVRTPADVEAIKTALSDGTIDVIASDHAPHCRDEKELEFNHASFGIIGLETTLSIVITELVVHGVIPLSEAIRKMTINPAKILNLEIGRLKNGAAADITVIDMNINRVVDVTKFQSKSKNSPFHGKTFQGLAVHTIVDGKIVMRDQQIVG